MLGERYTVVKGDNLSKIALRTLGSAKEWQRLWKYNNRPEVINVTGRAIPNPDLIREGQLLLIPRLPKVPTRVPSPVTGPSLSGAQRSAPARPRPVAPPGSPSVPLAEQAQDAMRTLSFKYRHDYRLPPTDIGNAIIEVRASGDILLMTKRAYPAAYLTSRGEIELQVNQQANYAFGKLVGDNRYIYDPVENRIAFRSMLISQSTTPNAPATAIGVEVSSQNPIPKLRAEIRLPKLEGSIDVFHYVALDVKLIIEITPKGTRRDTPAGPDAVVQPITVVQPRENWAWCIGAGLLATSVVIVVATIIEDFVTGGAGVPDDPASFSAAAATAVEGMAMMSGAEAKLPRAPLPTSVEVRTRVDLATQVR